MKILKRNEEKVPERWTKELLCGGCGSLLEVGTADLARFSGSSPRGGSWNYAAFQCPLCHEWNTLEVPKYVLKAVPGAGTHPPTPAVKSTARPSP